MIKPMSAELAITTARQIYQLMYGIDEIDEKTFIRAIAPEILGAAKAENLAAQEIVSRWCEYDCSDELKELRERYIKQ
jgi:hypothetical protein